jgi:hypothetical protein
MAVKKTHSAKEAIRPRRQSTAKFKLMTSLGKSVTTKLHLPSRHKKILWKNCGLPEPGSSTAGRVAPRAPEMEQKGTKETKFFVIFVCFC